MKVEIEEKALLNDSRKVAMRKFIFITVILMCGANISCKSPENTSQRDSGSLTSVQPKSVSSLPTAVAVTTPSKSTPDAMSKVASTKPARISEEQVHTLCEQIHALQKKEIKKIGGSIENHPELADIYVPGVNSRQQLKNSFGQCISSGQGVWGLVLSNLKADADIGKVQGSLSLMHFDIEGKQTQTFVNKEYGIYTRNYSWFEPLQAFDFDNDGVDELIVIEQFEYGLLIQEGDRLEQGSIWTLKKGVIQPYILAKDISFAKLSDFDGDGRPDLWFRAKYNLVVEKWYRSQFLWPIHSREDGSFSKDDNAVMTQLKKQCPEAPKTLLCGDKSSAEKGDWKSLEEELRCMIRTISCARAWGVSAQEVIKHYKEECAQTKNGSRMCRYGYPGEWGLWAKIEPPVQLRP